jgi:DNA-binding MarR family transcriptional regulator
MKTRRRKSAADAIARDCLASRVRYLNRVLSSIYDQDLRPLRITINQLNMLVALSRIPDVTAKKVGAFLHMDPSTTSRNLERMRKAGWIQSTTGEDARSVRLGVTPSGTRMIEKAFPYWRKAQAKASEVIGREHIQALLQFSRTMT